MTTAYASFTRQGRTEKLNSQEQLSFEEQCEWAGYHYAKAGNDKLPARVTVGQRCFPVVKSRLLEAKAFSKGWKAYWVETLGCLPAEFKRRQRLAKQAAKAS